MTHTVLQAAQLLDVLTAKKEYVSAAQSDTQLRIGVVPQWMTSNSEVNSRFEEARALLEKSGIKLVEVELTAPETQEHEDELMVLLYELGTGLRSYLATRSGARVSSLLDVVNFNKKNSEDELKHFGQEHFVNALEIENKKEEYLTARNRNKLWAEKTLSQGLMDVDILIGCTYGPAWESSLEHGDKFDSASWITTAPAIAGTPIGTIPMGLASGLPVGLGFVSARNQEAKLITAMAQAERALGFGVMQPSFQK
jgi:amidase